LSNFVREIDKAVPNETEFPAVFMGPQALRRVDQRLSIGVK
jgi:hypothetical protein